MGLGALSGALACACVALSDIRGVEGRHGVGRAPPLERLRDGLVGFSGFENISPSIHRACHLVSDLLDDVIGHAREEEEVHQEDESASGAGPGSARGLPPILIPLRINLVFIGFQDAADLHDDENLFERTLEASLIDRLPHRFVKSTAEQDSAILEYRPEYHVALLDGGSLEALELGLAYYMRDEGSSMKDRKYISSWNMEVLLGQVLAELQADEASTPKSAGVVSLDIPAVFTVFLLNPRRENLPKNSGYGYRWGYSRADMDAVNSDPELEAIIQNANRDKTQLKRGTFFGSEEWNYEKDDSAECVVQPSQDHTRAESIIGGRPKLVLHSTGGNVTGQQRWASLGRSFKSREPLPSAAREVHRNFLGGAVAGYESTFFGLLDRYAFLQHLLDSKRQVHFPTNGREESCVSNLGTSRAERFAWVDFQASHFYCGTPWLISEDTLTFPWSASESRGSVRDDESSAEFFDVLGAVSEVQRLNTVIAAELVRIQERSSRLKCTSINENKAFVEEECNSLKSKSGLLGKALTLKHALGSIASEGGDSSSEHHLLLLYLGVLSEIVRTLVAQRPDMNVGSADSSPYRRPILSDERSLSGDAHRVELSDVGLVVNSLLRTALAPPSSLPIPTAPLVDTPSSRQLAGPTYKSEDTFARLLREGTLLMSNAMAASHSSLLVESIDALRVSVASRLDYSIFLIGLDTIAASAIAQKLDLTGLEKALAEIHLPGQQVSVTTHVSDVSRDPALAIALANGLKHRSFGGYRDGLGAVPSNLRKYIDSDEIYTRIAAFDAKVRRWDGVERQSSYQGGQRAIDIVIFAFDGEDDIFVDETYRARLVDDSIVVVSISSDSGGSFRTCIREVICRAVEALGGLLPYRPSPVWGEEDSVEGSDWSLSSSLLSPVAPPSLLGLSFIQKEAMARSVCAQALIASRKLLVAGINIVNSISGLEGPPARFRYLYRYAEASEHVIACALQEGNMKRAIELLSPLLGVARNVHGAAMELLAASQEGSSRSRCGEPSPSGAPLLQSGDIFSSILPALLSSIISGALCFAVFKFVGPRRGDVIFRRGVKLNAV